MSTVDGRGGYHAGFHFRRATAVRVCAADARGSAAHAAVEGVALRRAYTLARPPTHVMCL